MSLQTVTLVSGWKKRGRTLGVNVGFVQDDELAKLHVSKDSTVQVNGRAFAHLEAAGLIESSEPVTLAADEGAPSFDPGPAHPGGVGHQPDDGYSNVWHVQREIQQDKMRGLIQRAEAGLGPVTDDELPENLRRDGRLVQADPKPDEPDPSDDEPAPKPKQPEPVKASRSRGTKS